MLTREAPIKTEPSIIEPAVSSSQPVSKNPFQNTNSLLQEKVSSKSKRYQPLTITITECLSTDCTAFYTDAISESIVIQCKDSRHNNPKESAGQVTNPRPAPDDASFTPTKVNSQCIKKTSTEINI